MLSFESRCLRCTAAALLVAAALWACAVSFGVTLLGNRSQVLDPPVPSFLDELSSIVPRPKDNLRAVEGWETDVGGAEAEGLSPASVATIKRMREMKDGDTAFHAGENLPDSVRHYTAGAVWFRAETFQPAAEHFSAILALPAERRADREVWAEFMLGRIARGRGDAAAAITHFQACRNLARKGSFDRLGLAVGSLGEEARVRLDKRQVVEAVRLYAEQAAYGSESGRMSLLFTAEKIIGDEALLDSAIRDDIGRRLIFLCLGAEAAPNSDFESSGGPGATTPNEPESNSLVRILKSLERNGIKDASGSGLLAAAAYSQGRYDLASALAKRDNTTLSNWILAKVALRDGDSAAALRSYDAAIRTQRQRRTPVERPNRLEAENGVVRLIRGDYIQALESFFNAVSDARSGSFADYWDDAAYIAERVLTPSELRQFVDRRIPATTEAQREDALEKGLELPGLRLRSVLARSLMRAGQRKEALRYFDDDQIRSVAEEYVQALSVATSYWRSRVSRAEAWFNAANLARFDGMEILGYELEPDFAGTDGSFPGTEEDTSGADDPVPPEAGPAGRKNDEGFPVRPRTQGEQRQTDQLQFLSAGERERVKASLPPVNVRFHYRLTAVDHAMKAADLLPRSSQAFASVLCFAAKWSLDRTPDRAETIYRRYVQEGAYVPWGRDFGRRCPPPDFGAAGQYWITKILLRSERVLSNHPVHAASLGFSVIALGVAGWFAARRYRPRLGRLKVRVRVRGAGQE